MRGIRLDSTFSRELLSTAAEVNGIPVAGSELIRNGSHVMWATPAGIVARVGERGTVAVSRKEVSISRWLNDRGIRAVRTVDGLIQPTVVDGHPVTWWELLPGHRQATPAELGTVLRRLHSLHETPDLELPTFSPCAGVRERLSNASGANPDDAAWILNQMELLEPRYVASISGLPHGLIHGDAWQGNVVIADGGDPIVLDFEAFGLGLQYWDLIALAVDYTDFGRISKREYEDFVSSYGFDVTNVAIYRTLAEIQELRWTSYVLGKAKPGTAEEKEAALRISCLKGEVSRPWKWNAF